MFWHLDVYASVSLCANKLHIAIYSSYFQAIKTQQQLKHTWKLTYRLKCFSNVYPGLMFVVSCVRLIRYCSHGWSVISTTILFSPYQLVTLLLGTAELLRLGSREKAVVPSSKTNSLLVTQNTLKTHKIWNNWQTTVTQNVFFPVYWLACCIYSSFKPAIVKCIWWM